MAVLIPSWITRLALRHPGKVFIGKDISNTGYFPKETPGRLRHQKKGRKLVTHSMIAAQGRS